MEDAPIPGLEKVGFGMGVDEGFPGVFVGDGLNAVGHIGQIQKLSIKNQNVIKMQEILIWEELCIKLVNKLTKMFGLGGGNVDVGGEVDDVLG